MKFFEQLVAENNAYMLGSHPAREGNKPRGWSNQSAYANIGFYKRDPSLDVQKSAGEAIPESVIHTINIIVRCFYHINEIQKETDILYLIIPYIQDFEYLRSVLRQYTIDSQKLESALKRKENLEGEIEDEESAKELQNLIKVIDELKRKVELLDQDISFCSNELEEQRPEILSTIVQTMCSLCKDANLFNTKDFNSDTWTNQIKEAFEKYISLVNGRREERKTGLNRTYLFVDPVISFMRFYNNAITLYRRKKEKEKAEKERKFSSSSDVLVGNSKLAMLDFMIDCMSKLTKLRIRQSKIKEQKVLLSYITKAYDVIAPKLDDVSRIRFAILVNKFKEYEPYSEGRLKEFLLTTVQRQIK